MDEEKRKQEQSDAAGPPRTPPNPSMIKGAEDLDFVSDAAAAVLEDTPRGGRFIVWSVLLFFALAGVWASRAELDEVTRGVGKVIPSRQVQVIQNLEGGIVGELLVHEGDIVDKGQVLIKIDDVRFSSSFRESRLRYLALAAKAARLRAEALGEEFKAPEEVVKEQPELVERERELYDTRQQQLEANLRILREQETQRRQELAELEAKKGQVGRSYNLAYRELVMTRPLVKDGAISEVEVLRLERQVNDLRGDLKATELAIPRVQSRLDEAQRKLEEARLAFRNEARTELNETTAEMGRLSESNIALEDRVERTLVRSPVRGEVKRLLVTTEGGVVQPGMDLVEIVPLEDSLMVEARISPRDIGFLHPGQPATVKFTAYDFAIYGGLPAKLEQISPDSLTDEKGDTYYQVRVRTDRNHLGNEQKPLPIIPGMQASVDILTGKKTVLEYLLKPVLRAKEYALRER